jgi:hypothetical protein
MSTIRVNDLNIITNPLDQELMQGRRYATVGMNPIPPQDDTIATLHLDDEECGCQSLAPHGQLHGSNSLGSNGITTTNVIDHHVGLDHLLVGLAHLLEKRIRHQVDYSSSIDEHPRDRCAIKMPPDVQRLQVVLRVLRPLKHSIMWAKTHLRHLIITYNRIILNQ